MKILNLHIHILGFNVYNDNKFRSKDNLYEIKPNTIFETDYDKYLISFKCMDCDEFYDDYQSYPYKDYFPKYYRESIFSCKKMIKNFRLKNDIKIFEFVELSNLYLIGTKNEIISYIYKENYKLDEKYNNSQKLIINLDSNIKQKEKDILKLQENLQKEKSERNKIENKLETINNKNKDLSDYLKIVSDSLKEEKQKSSDLNSTLIELKGKQEKLTKENDLTKSQLKNEKKSKKDLELKYSELQEQSKQKNIQNKELEKNLNEKEIKIKNLIKNNKDLGINVENLKKNLNSKEDEIKEISYSLNNALQNLETEKDKNKELNNKLDNISIENNKNVKNILTLLENEKKLTKDLESKYSELKEQANQKNIENKELAKNLNEKEVNIKNLTKNKKDLEINVENLKKNLNLKENQIKEINNSLNKEKNIKQNILQNLQNEKDKNKELNNKLENISIETNKNISAVLTQLENEKLSKKNLETKFGELQKNEKEKIRRNKELEKNLEEKDKELKSYQKNNFGLKFESDSKSGDYDIILDITSFQDLVNKDKGWIIKYNKKDGKKKYETKKDEPTIIVGVIGNGNKGKSFFLEKLSGYDIPKGFNIKTEGLSIRYGTSQEHNVAILDSAGQETPLLKVVNENKKKENISSNNIEEKKDILDANSTPKENGDTKEVKDKPNEQKKDEEPKGNIENNNPKKSEQLEDEDIEFEKYSRDKLITEFFLQKFIIYKSDILILVIGNISLTEQKLLSRVKAEVDAMDKTKQIYVIHNLKDYSTEEQVEDYINNTLKKLYNIEIEEILRQKIRKDDRYNEDCFNKYFVEKGKKVIHLIFVNEFSDKANYYNIPTIEFIQKEIEVIKTRNKFSIINDCKEFLVKISEEIMEGNPKIENLEIQEGKDYDKLILKNMKEITLKKFVVDEMGYTLNNDSNTPKYSYYIDTEKKMLFINIELPGGGSIEPRVEIVSGYYIFIFEGEKKGDCAIEEDKKKEESKLIQKKNLRKSNKFKLEIKIPNSVMQIKLEEGEDLNDVGEFIDSKKGVYTFKYKVLILNQKSEKSKKIKKIDL